MESSMRPNLVELVACPRCAGDLSVEATTIDGDEINAGVLGCAGCDTRFPIVDGIPRLLPEPSSVSSDAQRTVDRFGDQWNDFDSIGDHYEKQFLGWIHPNTPRTFEGKIVLEAGCGKGRHSTLAAQWGAKR